MRRVTVPLGERSYEILIGRELLAALGGELRALGLHGSAALVYDAGLPPDTRLQAQSSLQEAGFAVAPVAVPSGEPSKCLEQLGRLYGEFAAAALDRTSTVIALGGGMVGDLAGFAAATYLRGIHFVQVPTTLLAQVDASVGGKTAIDIPAGKNLAGAFHQPRLVLADLGTLDTLPHREYLAGLAEVIKYGVIRDAEFFRFLEENREAILRREPAALAHVVARSCEIKAEIVGVDERESGLRAILNYGHTLGHAVELVAGLGSYLHGECVALGMVAAGWLSQRLAGFHPGQAQRVRDLIQAYGLPTALAAPLSPDSILQAMLRDKKTRRGELQFVLAREVGRVETVPVSHALAVEALSAIAPGAAGP